MMRQRTRGFTIVELLIVIVVIGILAAITIVAYNGVRDKAVNTQRVSAAKEYQTILHQYIVQYGKYPATQGDTTTYCLGDGYSDWNSDGVGDCFASNNIKNSNTALNNELKKITSALPDFNKATVKNGAIYNLGVATRGISIDGVAGRQALFYWLKGSDLSCGLGDLLTIATGNNYTSTPNKNSGSSSESTSCVVAIPDPGNF